MISIKKDSFNTDEFIYQCQHRLGLSKTNKFVISYILTILYNDYKHYTVDEALNEYMKTMHNICNIKSWKSYDW